MNWLSKLKARREAEKTRLETAAAEFRRRQEEGPRLVQSLSLEQAQRAWRAAEKDDDLVTIFEPAASADPPGLGPAVSVLLRGRDSVTVVALQVGRFLFDDKAPADDLMVIGAQDDGEALWYQVKGQDAILVGAPGESARPRMSFASVFHALLAEYLLYTEEDIETCLARLVGM